MVEKFMDEGNVDDAATTFQSTLHGMCRFYIPWGKLEEKRSTHPWLNSHCTQAIEKKNAAEGTDGYKDACDECEKVLKASYLEYDKNLREKIAALPKNSKSW